MKKKPISPCDYLIFIDYMSPLAQLTLLKLWRANDFSDGYAMYSKQEVIERVALPKPDLLNALWELEVNGWIEFENRGNRKAVCVYSFRRRVISKTESA